MKHTKHRRPVAVLALGLALGLAASSGAVATTLTPMHVDDMSGAADTVVVGTVQSQEAIRIDNGIYTVLTVSVDEAVAGQAGATVEVLVPGGSIESNGIRVGEVNAGAVTAYGMDSEVVFFLTAADANGHRQVLGYSQGQFAVNGGMVSVPDLGGAITLDEFTTRIRAHR